MAEGTDNIEGCQSCNDSSYNERTLRLLTVAMVFTADARAGKMAVALQTCRERSLYQFERTGSEDDFASLHPGPTSAHGLERLQLALVLISMCTHTNQHVLQLSLCGGGGCIWW